MTTTPASGENLELVQTVERYDRDRFLAALGTPAAARPTLVALLALNLELARTREAVREPMAGRIRLQWWRDSLSALESGGAIRRHDIPEALAPAARAGRLDYASLRALIDGRERDLEDAPPRDMAELETYARATSSTLLIALLHALGVGDPASLEAAEHLGVAWALAGLARAVPFHVSRGRRWLPDAALERAGLSESAYRSGRFVPPLGIVVQELVDTAHSRIEAARKVRGRVASAALPILGLARVADAHLAGLARAGFDAYAAAALADRWAPLRLAWAKASGRY